MLEITQNANYSTGGMLETTQNANYSIGGMLKKHAECSLLHWRDAWNHLWNAIHFLGEMLETPQNSNYYYVIRMDEITYITMFITP